MIKKILSIALALQFVSFNLSPFPRAQQNIVVKHRGAGTISFVQSSFTPQTGSTMITSLDTSAHPITVTAGDLLFVVCRQAQGGSPTVWAPTSVPSNTFHLAGTSSAVLANYNGYVSFASAGGSTVFTCSGSSASFASIIVLEYHPGFLASIDTSTSGSGSATGTTIQTPSFNTSAKGLIIACGTTDVVGTNTFTAGTIGSGSATLRQTDNGSASTGTNACEDSITSGSQSGIVGTMTINTSEDFVAFAAALK